jgi:hypothetical protein
MKEGGEKKDKSVPTDVVYDGVKLGLVPRGEEDIETRFGELNRKLASDAIRRARDDLVRPGRQADKADSKDIRHIARSKHAKRRSVLSVLLAKI